MVGASILLANQYFLWNELVWYYSVEESKPIEPSLLAVELENKLHYKESFGKYIFCVIYSYGVSWTHVGDDNYIDFRFVKISWVIYGYFDSMTFWCLHVLLGLGVKQFPEWICHGLDGFVNVEFVFWFSVKIYHRIRDIATCAIIVNHRYRYIFNYDIMSHPYIFIRR